MNRTSNQAAWTCLFQFLLTIFFSYYYSFLLFHDILEVGEDFKVVLVKRLTFGKGELLEGHAWSSDDQIFAVAGYKIYLSKVSIILSQSIFSPKNLFTNIISQSYSTFKCCIFLIRSVRDLPVFIPFPCITCQKTFP